MGMELALLAIDFSFRKRLGFQKQLAQLSGKTGSAFRRNGQICHRLDRLPVTLGKIQPPTMANQPPMLGRSAANFGTISHQFWGKTGSVFEKKRKTWLTPTRRCLPACRWKKSMRSQIPPVQCAHPCASTSVQFLHQPSNPGR